MRRAIGLIVISLLIITLVILAFSIEKPQKKGKKIEVAVSIYPLAEFSRQAGGQFVNVSNITSAGVEPHDFEPTPQDIVKINRADIFIFNGAGLDPWAKKLAPELESKGILVIEMSKYFKIKRASENQDGGKMVPDPHIWLDPVLAKREVEIIKDALIETDARHSDAYRTNSRKYTTELSALNSKFKRGLANLRLREIIVSHAAFAYLARRYNIKMIPVAISPNEEPSSRQIGRLVQIVRRKNIKYIFFETLASPKTAKTIAEEAGVKTLVLNPIEGLTLQEAKEKENYISIMEQNLHNLRLALE